MLVAYKYKLPLRESNKKLFIQEKNCSSVAKDCGGMDSQYVQFKDAQCVINKQTQYQWVALYKIFGVRLFKSVDGQWRSSQECSYIPEI